MHLQVTIDGIHDPAHAARYLRNIAQEIEQANKPHWSKWNGGGGSGVWALETERGQFRTDRQLNPLHDADPTCQHEVVDAPGGGVKCTKCSGWFCY